MISLNELKKFEKISSFSFLTESNLAQAVKATTSTE